MEKYSVKTEVGKTKTASITKVCPSCGGKISTKANVPHCDKCGTAPFESKK